MKIRIRQNRNEKVIKKDILKVIIDKGGSARTTHLIHKSNLSTITFRQHIANLKKNRLVKETKINNKSQFSITEAGFRWISTST